MKSLKYKDTVCINDFVTLDVINYLEENKDKKGQKEFVVTQVDVENKKIQIDYSKEWFSMDNFHRKGQKTVRVDI